MNTNARTWDGIELLSERFGINFTNIARETCFLAATVATVKKHYPAPHIYTTERIGELRVGWIAKEGYALARQGKYKAALERFDEALRLEPQYVHALNHKGLCYYFLENYTASVICFTAATTINRQFCEAYINKGCALQRLNQFDSATECFEEAESINDNLFEIWNNKSISSIAFGDFTGALNCLDRVIALHCYKPSVYALRGICFLSVDLPNEAYTELTFGLKLDPTNRMVSNLLRICGAMFT